MHEMVRDIGAFRWLGCDSKALSQPLELINIEKRKTWYNLILNFQRNLLCLHSIWLKFKGVRRDGSKEYLDHKIEACFVVYKVETSVEN